MMSEETTTCDYTKLKNSTLDSLLPKDDLPT